MQRKCYQRRIKTKKTSQKKKKKQRLGKRNKFYNQNTTFHFKTFYQEISQESMVVEDVSSAIKVKSSATIFRVTKENIMWTIPNRRGKSRDTRIMQGLHY